ncbi:MAG TPA: Calx-beta domain-containing protein [Thermoanaerobaculia bacterium]|jgi:hypothetical protein
MRRATIAVFLFSAAALRAHAACPVKAPSPWMFMHGPFTFAAGSAGTLRLAMSLPPAPQPCGPLPCDDVYGLQSCDVLTWDFGDGTPPVTGTRLNDEEALMDHTYAAPGTYQPAVTISNALGQVIRYGAVTVTSDPPAYVDFSPAAVTTPETAGSITFTLERSGNLTTTATVHTWHPPRNQGEGIERDVVFAPGETTKSVTMKVFDDHAYTGSVTGFVVATATDGTLFHTASFSYTLTETSPQPTATVEDARVTEGGGTADVVVRVSAPLGFPVLFHAQLADGTAKAGDDYLATTPFCEMQPGETNCVLHVGIVDDDDAESDETFTVKVAGDGPLFLGDTATVTIVDDDAARILVAEPPSLVLLPGAHGTVRISMQPPKPTEQMLALSSTHPEVASVPESLTIPAGGSATLDIHALASGTAKIAIGSSFSVEVTVAVPRRRASR